MSKVEITDRKITCKSLNTWKLNNILLNNPWIKEEITRKIFKRQDTGGFWSRWQHRQTGLAPSHNHINVTTKIQNNHHSGMSEIKLNGSLTTTELKTPHPSRPVGGAQIWDGLAPHPCGQKFWRDISGARSLRHPPAPPRPGFQC